MKCFAQGSSLMCNPQGGGPTNSHKHPKQLFIAPALWGFPKQFLWRGEVYTLTP